MKIGLVSGEYPPMEGGVGAFTEELARALSQQGEEVHIVTSRKARPKSVERSLWDHREPYDLGYASLHPRVNRWWWSAMSTIAEIVERYDLDVVNVQYQAAAYDMCLPAINFLPWRLQKMVKTVVTFHDLRVPYLFPKAGGLRKSLVYRLARSASGVIVTNMEDLEELAGHNLPRERLERIPIGSNIAPNEPSPADIQRTRDGLGCGGECFLLGYFGFLNESKGADTLITAFSRLPKRFELVFIGGKTGSSDSARNRAFLDRIQSQISDEGLGSRVHWSGFLNQYDVSCHLSAADIMVMPYRDGASLRRGTLMAILSHARPLITTHPGSPIELLEHGHNVWLTAVDDPIALGEAIMKLAADSELRNNLGENAGATSKLFSWDSIAERTRAFYKDIIDSDL